MAHVRWVEDHGLYQRVHVVLDHPYMQVVHGLYDETVISSPYVSVFSGHITKRKNGRVETAPYLTDEYGDPLVSGEPVAIYYGLVVGKAIHKMGEVLV